MPDQEPKFRQSIIKPLLEDERKLPPTEIIIDEDNEPPPLPPVPNEINPIKKLARQVDEADKKNG